MIQNEVGKIRCLEEESLLWTPMQLALADGINLKTNKVLICDQPEDCGLTVDILF